MARDGRGYDRNYDPREIYALAAAQKSGKGPVVDEDDDD